MDSFYSGLSDILVLLIWFHGLKSAFGWRFGRELDKAGCDLTLSSPFWLTDVEKRAPTMSPVLGEHNDEVLDQFGFNAADVQAPRNDGAFS